MSETKLSGDLILLDERAAAKLLGLTPRTLQAWRYYGTGPKFVRISARCIRFRLSDLESFIAARVVSSTSAETANQD